MFYRCLTQVILLYWASLCLAYPLPTDISPTTTCANAATFPSTTAVSTITYRPSVPTSRHPLFPRYNIWREGSTQDASMSVCNPSQISNGTLLIDGNKIFDLDNKTLTILLHKHNNRKNNISLSGSSYGDAISSVISIHSNITYYRKCVSGRPVLVYHQGMTFSNISPFQDRDWRAWIQQNGQFSKSVIPYIYSMGASTTLSLILTAIVLGFQNRPILYKLSLVLSSAYLITVTICAIRTLKNHHNQGFLDSYVLRQSLRTSPLYAINLTFNTIVYLAQVQTTMLLFSRQKEKRMVFWLGGSLTIVSQTIWGISVFHPAVLQSSLPAFTYLFQIAIAIMYFFCTLYYAITHMNTIFDPSVIGFTVFAISMPAVSLVLFIVDLANVWVMEWSDAVSWVASVLAIISVWEWFVRIDQLERIKKKNGILGRQVYDDDALFGPDGCYSTTSHSNPHTDYTDDDDDGDYDNDNDGNDSEHPPRGSNGNSSSNTSSNTDRITLTSPLSSAGNTNESDTTATPSEDKNNFKFTKSRPQRLAGTGGLLLGRGRGYEGQFFRGSNTLIARFDDKHSFLLLQRGTTGEPKSENAGDQGAPRSSKELQKTITVPKDQYPVFHHPHRKSDRLALSTVVKNIGNNDNIANNGTHSVTEMTRNLQDGANINHRVVPVSAANDPVTARPDSATSPSTASTPMTWIQKYYNRAVVNPIVTVSDFLISLGLAVSRPMSTDSHASDPLPSSMSTHPPDASALMSAPGVTTLGGGEQVKEASPGLMPPGSVAITAHSAGLASTPNSAHIDSGKNVVDPSTDGRLNGTTISVTGNDAALLSQNQGSSMADDNGGLGTTVVNNIGQSLSRHQHGRTHSHYQRYFHSMHRSKVVINENSFIEEEDQT